MRVTIHQPEHFPYMGFFQKMKESDLFVILDVVKFRKNYFQNRNRFVNRQGREEWFTVPVKSGSNSLKIKEVETLSDEIWRKKVEKQISLNLGIDVGDLYRDTNSLLEINMRSINMSRSRFQIETPLVLASSLGVEGSKTELLVDICRKTGAKTYISGPSGKDYLEENLFNDAGIKVEYFSPAVLNHMSSIYNFSEAKR